MVPNSYQNFPAEVQECLRLRKVLKSVLFLGDGSCGNCPEYRHHNLVRLFITLIVNIPNDLYLPVK